MFTPFSDRLIVSDPRSAITPRQEAFEAAMKCLDGKSHDL